MACSLPVFGVHSLNCRASTLQKPTLRQQNAFGNPPSRQNYGFFGASRAHRIAIRPPSPTARLERQAREPSVPDIDQNAADRLILVEVRKALDDIEKKLLG
jgi:hypothetical protein